MNIKEMLEKLSSFWQEQGVTLLSAYDIEKGAATFNPNTFLAALKPKDSAVAYLEPCRRPQDGRYGENPNRLYQHHQFQVFIKPAPNNIKELYLKSLESIGIDASYDIKFLEDNWEQPTLGAFGLGSEVQVSGMEVTQFTYFDKVGNIEIKDKPVELAYGVERLALLVQGRDNVFELDWDDRKYSELFKDREYQFSKYIFETANIDRYWKFFDMYMKEAELSIEEELFFVAYDLILKASNAFNILDAKKAIAPADRKGYILRISELTQACCRGII